MRNYVIYDNMERNKEVSPPRNATPKNATQTQVTWAKMRSWYVTARSMTIYNLKALNADARIKIARTAAATLWQLATRLQVTWQHAWWAQGTILYAMQKNIKRCKIINYVVHTRYTHSDERMNDNDQDTLVEEVDENAKAIQEYAVVHVARHIGKFSNVKYVEQWYGYTPNDDTFQLPNNIPPYFIPSNWCWVRGTRERRRSTNLQGQ